ncbi:MAG TPA: hypothetical protein VKR58_01480 [Aquella sp.]|nr:hypothetical protein [Aquella sp.]
MKQSKVKQLVFSNVCALCLYCVTDNAIALRQTTPAPHETSFPYCKVQLVNNSDREIKFGWIKFNTSDNAKNFFEISSSGSPVINGPSDTSRGCDKNAKNWQGYFNYGPNLSKSFEPTEDCDLGDIKEDKAITVEVYTSDLYIKNLNTNSSCHIQLIERQI